MERVPTWANSPYLGMFQYKNAGPDRIHERMTPQFFLPPSPYLGALRHDMFHVPLVFKSDPPKTRTVSTQTDICLSAYVIDGYSEKEF